MRQHSIHMLPGNKAVQEPNVDGLYGGTCADEAGLKTALNRAAYSWEMITVRTDDGAQIGVDLVDLSMRPQERNTLAALIRGVAAAYALRDVEIEGFEIEMQTKGLPGNGLTTYYGFALLVAGIINEMFCDCRFSPAGVAEIARFAETEYFGKRTNQLDPQMASVSGIALIDMSNAGNKKDKFISFYFNDSGLRMCVIDRVDGGEYTSGNTNVAAEDIREACEYLGKKRIADVDEEEFFRELPKLRGNVSDQSIFSAIRTYIVKREAQKKVEAMQRRDFDAFVHLAEENDKRVWIYLQN